MTISPLALAIWIMDDGSRSGQSLKISTNQFSYTENLKLKFLLYPLVVSIHKTGTKDQYNLYIHKKSKPLLRSIILPYLHPSKNYK